MPGGAVGRLLCNYPLKHDNCCPLPRTGNDSFGPLACVRRAMGIPTTEFSGVPVYIPELDKSRQFGLITPGSGIGQQRTPFNYFSRSTARQTS